MSDVGRAGGGEWEVHAAEPDVAAERMSALPEQVGGDVAREGDRNSTNPPDDHGAEYSLGLKTRVDRRTSPPLHRYPDGFYGSGW